MSTSDVTAAIVSLPALGLAGAEPQGVTRLVLDGIVRRWGKRTVLDGAGLRLTPGTVTWLGGANGAGKTTLIRVAAGFLIPHAGSVSLGGLDPERDRRAYQRRLGFLSAGDRGLYARLTVLQNLDYWAGIALIPRGRRAALIGDAVRRFNLEDLAYTRADRMSMGQRQRVRLAMTFLHRPEVVLLDEPHTSLDDSSLTLLEAALRELTNQGGAALWCSPSAAYSPLRADVRQILEGGRVHPL